MKDENENVFAYSSVRNIDGRLYGEIICAKSADVAEEICRKMGTEYDGKIVGFLPQFTASSIMNFISSNSLIKAEWSEKTSELEFNWTGNANEAIEAFLNRPTSEM